MLREKLTRHYQYEVIARKRKNGEIQEAWNGTTVGYSYSSTQDDEAEVNQNVERALSAGEVPMFFTRYTDLEDLETSLSMAINALRESRNEIEAPLFDASRPVGLVHEVSISVDDLKAYLVQLYSAFLSNYKTLIDKNFPTLRSHFRLYSELPVAIYLVLESAVDRQFGYVSTPLTLYFVKAEPGQSVVRVAEEVVWDRSEDGVCFTVSGIVHEVIFWISTTVESALRGASELAYDHFRGMTLRRLVYSMLLKELPAVEAAFRSSVACQEPRGIASPDSDSAT